jgi:hypothetical protein
MLGSGNAKEGDSDDEAGGGAGRADDDATDVTRAGSLVVSAIAEVVVTTALVALVTWPSVVVE